MPVDLLLCVATDMECAALRQRFGSAGPSIAIVRTGVGAVNAAHAVTLFLAATGARAIVVCGIGGAYPESGLKIGDVVCASTECYGDLGAATPTGFLDMKALGFPIVDGPPPIFTELPMQVFPLNRRVPFVTVSTCTGTAATARAIADRTGGAVENMEGAAIAHVGRLHDVPVGEVRAISNIVTDRDTSAWRVAEAAAAAQDALIEWVATR
jgi:futalosine hydrolase